MGGETVANICVGGTDSTGATILTVYTKILGRYAVYKTEERVSIQFADNSARGDAQRLLLAPLNPLRGQISGLIDGWRTSADAGDRTRAILFDRRIADALGVALQGCPAAVDHAMTLLAAIKDDVVAERTSKARFAYAVGAATTAALLIALACLFTWNGYRNIYAFSGDGMLLWLALGSAALGALFSVAIGLQNRQILTDLQRRENISDAILRIMIGSISGLVLVGLLLSELVGVSIGSAGGAIVAGSPHPWLVAAFVAFLAGFSERLVPSLLEESAASAVRGGAQGGSNPLTGSPPPPVAPAGRTQPAAPPPGDSAPPAGESGFPADPEEDVDGCMEDGELSEAEITHDVELPAAEGGVENPPSG